MWQKLWHKLLRGYYSRPMSREVFCEAKSRVSQRQNAIYCILYPKGQNCAWRSVLLFIELRFLQGCE